mmetsp:Transcript_6943/g.14410  ORF Transcript_6943/g.14410 Transcript_6943/m.14410 type:complete len:201 (-) Transcript_6943:1372-1974(-)
MSHSAPLAISKMHQARCTVTSTREPSTTTCLFACFRATMKGHSLSKLSMKSISSCWFMARPQIHTVSSAGRAMRRVDTNSLKGSHQACVTNTLAFKPSGFAISAKLRPGAGLLVRGFTSRSRRRYMSGTNLRTLLLARTCLCFMVFSPLWSKLQTSFAQIWMTRLPSMSNSWLSQYSSRPSQTSSWKCSNCAIDTPQWEA